MRSTGWAALLARGVARSWGDPDFRPPPTSPPLLHAYCLRPCPGTVELASRACGLCPTRSAVLPRPPILPGCKLGLDPQEDDFT